MMLWVSPVVWRGRTGALPTRPELLGCPAAWVLDYVSGCLHLALWACWVAWALGWVLVWHLYLAIWACSAAWAGFSGHPLLSLDRTQEEVESLVMMVERSPVWGQRTQRGSEDDPGRQEVPHGSSRKHSLPKTGDLSSVFVVGGPPRTSGTSI